MQSTLAIFHHLYDCLPPLFPESMKQKMERALRHLEESSTVTVEEIEDTMIAFGYETWPWNQACRQFLAVAETQVAEHFLLPKLSLAVQNKYEEFKRYGGTLADLHSGNSADFFTSEERNELCPALIETQLEVRQYIERALVGDERPRYLKCVGEFSDRLGEIAKILHHLRGVADQEQDHPVLAAEIRSRVRGFEFGLCLLGPELDYEAVCQSVDFFQGRKYDFNRLRGIQIPMAIDFFER